MLWCTSIINLKQTIVENLFSSWRTGRVTATAQRWLTGQVSVIKLVTHTDLVTTPVPQLFPVYSYLKYASFVEIKMFLGRSETEALTDKGFGRRKESSPPGGQRVDSCSEQTDGERHTNREGTLEK